MVNFLVLVSPDGIDKMFLELGDPVKAGSSLSASHITPKNMGKFKAKAEKYGKKLYPPDYFDKK